MNKKVIGYLIVITAIVLLIYGFYCLFSYNYSDFEKEEQITDSIKMGYPSSSRYSVSGDRIEFRNDYYGIYNMDVSKLKSSDKRLTNLLNHFTTVNQGTIDYKNESCYLLTIEFEDDSGFKYHSMIIPFDSFDKEKLSFTKDANVYLFDANNREFVVDSAFNSQVVI